MRIFVIIYPSVFYHFFFKKFQMVKLAGQWFFSIPKFGIGESGVYTADYFRVAFSRKKYSSSAEAIAENSSMPIFVVNKEYGGQTNIR